MKPISGLATNRVFNKWRHLAHMKHSRSQLYLFSSFTSLIRISCRLHFCEDEWTRRKKPRRTQIRPHSDIGSFKSSFYLMFAALKYARCVPKHMYVFRFVCTKLHCVRSGELCNRTLFHNNRFTDAIHLLKLEMLYGTRCWLMRCGSTLRPCTHSFGIKKKIWKW